MRNVEIDYKPELFNPLCVLLVHPGENNRHTSITETISLQKASKAESCCDEFFKSSYNYWGRVGPARVVPSPARSAARRGPRPARGATHVPP